jgi:beta-phosphoglucomutase family hydrolase
VGVVNWRDLDAVLLDLDGVITPTAEVHMRAWNDMFNDFLSGYGGSMRDRSPYTDADYFAYVDGKPRYAGVRDFLGSRGILLPEGSPEDAPSAETVSGLGNRKNDAFNAVLARDGVAAFPGTLHLLDHLHELGVVSSSANATAVLEAAGIADRFDTVVDGRVATETGLPGKPAPDTFLHAAEQLGAPPERVAVIEDAVSGVRAAAAGGFGLVIGVDRGAGEDTLRAAGAEIVVTDLAELAPSEGSGR